MAAVAMIIALLAVMVMLIGVTGILRGRVGWAGILDRRRSGAVAAAGFTVAVIAFGLAAPGGPTPGDVLIQADRPSSDRLVRARTDDDRDDDRWAGRREQSRSSFPTRSTYPDPVHPVPGVPGTDGARTLPRLVAPSGDPDSAGGPTAPFVESRPPSSPTRPPSADGGRRVSLVPPVASDRADAFGPDPGDRRLLPSVPSRRTAPRPSSNPSEARPSGGLLPAPAGGSVDPGPPAQAGPTGGGRADGRGDDCGPATAPGPIVVIPDLFGSKQQADAAMCADP
ncbi:hypothetical protein CcI6DRAFT_02250 [Frankia sp. CcI6]|uniref:hypothetical protein n=1 Tax=Frankia TaxID=1854 RepID=UPI0003D048F3|nr:MULTISPECIES: hypothetical protein [Frankia]ETA02261.1 hypothetical protein CcI6DRAFT_02250 [Frankia sp. CcI6]KFB03547.1 hypothetical protein ALLO2DRAFT_03699 [Frankia sp. Allo2]OAA22367.1 hypothetical protein AAY23_106623 [Frankia casuarinae]OFB43123.1 hypothetical protein Manayef4_12725 [Frankia sp. CgIM4]